MDFEQTDSVENGFNKLFDYPEYHILGFLGILFAICFILDQALKITATLQQTVSFDNLFKFQ